MNITFLTRASAAALACAMVLPLSAAQAQDEPAATDDVIIVTSQFREQNVLEVPLAVTAYDGEFLEEIGANSFAEVSNFTPGFVVQEQSVNNPGFVLRGITSDDGAATIEPRVSVFQNGVSIARSRGSIVQLHDLERVEVLKGPQGTLFGRSAQIGAVHVITQKPKYEFGAGFTAEAGNYDQQHYRGFVNAPLVDDVLAFRAAAAYERRNGFIDNPVERDLQGTDTYSLRGSLRFDPTDALRFDLIANYAKDDAPGTSFKSGVIPALGGTTDPNAFATLSTFGGFLDGRPLGVEREIFDVTLIAKLDLSDAWSVTSTSAYREFDSLEVFDPDGSAFEIFTFAEDATGEQWSSDVRFSFDDGGRFTGFFGGGVFAEKGTQSVPLGFDIGRTAALFGSLAAVGDPVNGEAPFGGSAFLASAFLSGDPAALDAALGLAGIPTGVFQVETFANSADNFSFDLFADVSYALTDRLTLTAGGRWTRDDKETLFFSEITEPNPFTPFIVGTPALLVGDSGGVISSDGFPGIDDSFSGFSWRAILNYEIADGKYVYFNHSRGRRPEVIEDAFATTPSGGATADFNIIPAETVTSYEVGAKGAFYDRMLTIEAAAYYYTYDNFQTGVQRDAGPGLPPIFETVNAGSADSYGAELGVNAAPTDSLDIFVTYGWNRGRFKDVDENGNPQIFAGNRFRLSPDHALSAGFKYEQESALGTFFLTPTYTWQSKVYFEDENTDAYDVVDPGTGATLFSVPAIAQEARGLVNIRGGLEFADGRYSVYGYVENLLDKDYIIDAGNTGGAFGVPTFIPGAPRFFGGGVTARF